MLQIRSPDLSDEEFWDLVDRIDGSIGSDAIKIVNPSRRSIADIGDADGIQLSESAVLGVPTARRRIGEKKLIGRSVHSVSGAVEASRNGADYLILGTVFPSASHPDGVTIGIHGISDATKKVEVPLIAIGGITPSNAGSVMHSGAFGIAVVRAILADSHPESAARRLWEAINES